MYSSRLSDDTLASPRPFENRALLNAVRHISGSLVRRTGVNARHSAYHSLLTHIWGQTPFATLDVLIEKHTKLADNRARAGKHRPRSRLSDRDLDAFRQSHEHSETSPQRHPSDPHLQRLNASREVLVRILRTVKQDSVTLNERKLTLDFLHRGKKLDVEGLRRLWGVPKVIFEASHLDSFFSTVQNTDTILEFYDQHIMRSSPDSRVFNILYWKQANHRDCKRETSLNMSTKPMWPCARNFRTISRDIIANVIKLLLTKRRSPFYERNMDVVIETVLYAIHPDGFVTKFRESSLHQAGFFAGLQSYEYSRTFTGSLENLHLGKLNRMLKDIRAVRAIQDTPTPAHEKQLELLSFRAISKYCAERDTLTERALRGVQDRYVRHRRCPVGNVGDVRMTVADFVRMYLALVGCGTDTGLKYWFSILDQDGDGWVSRKDVSHFYAERKSESEKRNGIVLADVQSLWIRLCAMLGVPPDGNGLTLSSLQQLGREEREFVMCALLVRRADDGNLINVAATVSSDPESASAM